MWLKSGKNWESDCKRAEKQGTPGTRELRFGRDSRQLAGFVARRKSW
jgi:hypothetical protein